MVPAAVRSGAALRYKDDYFLRDVQVVVVSKVLEDDDGADPTSIPSLESESSFHKQMLHSALPSYEPMNHAAFFDQQGA